MRTRRYLLGVLSGQAATVISVAVGLWLTPFILRYVGREQYGIVALGFTIINWLGLMDLGVSPGLKAHLARLTGVEDRSRIRSYAATAFLIELGVAATVGCAGTLFSGVFPDLFGVSDAAMRRDAVSMIAILAISAAISIAAQTFSAVLTAYQQMHIDNAIRIALVIVRAGITVALLVRGFGIVSLAVSHAAAVLITAALAAFRARRALPYLRVTPRAFSREAARAMVGVGLWFSVGSVAAILISGLDGVVAAKYVGLSAVTTLTLTKRLYELGTNLLNQLSETARPGLGQLLGAAEMKRAERVFCELSTVSTAIAIAASAAIWAGNGAFVAVWVGRNNYGGFILDAAFACNMVIGQWILANRAALTAGLAVRPASLARVVEGAVNLALSIAFTVRIGLAGVALGTTGAALLTSAWCLPKMTAQMFGRSLGALLQRGEPRRLLLLGALLIPVSAAARATIGSHAGYLHAIGAAGVTGLAGALAIWTVALTPENRRAVLARTQALAGAPGVCFPCVKRADPSTSDL